MLDNPPNKCPTAGDLRGRHRKLSNVPHKVSDIEVVTVIIQRALCTPVSISLPRVRFIEGEAP